MRYTLAAAMQLPARLAISISNAEHSGGPRRQRSSRARGSMGGLMAAMRAQPRK